MKIAMLTWEYPPRIVGGISRVVYELSQKLGKLGNEVHVVTCCEACAEEFEKDDYVYVHRVRLPSIEIFDFVQWVYHFNIAMIEYLVGLINKIGKLDLIHAHDWLVAFSAVTIKNSYCIPMISTIHATENGRNNGIYTCLQKYINSVEWWLTYQSSKVIVNSLYMKKEIIKIFNLPEDKVEIINNGIDIKKFKKYAYDINIRRRYARDDEKIIFFVGRLVQEKGVSILVEAMPKIIREYTDVKFVIVGKGAQDSYLKDRVNSMGIWNKVYFTGYLGDDDLRLLYRCVDVAVYPSLYEPFGIVALEAMLAGVSIVVSDVGGLGEIVQHNVDGKKFIVGNSNSLADCVLDILKDPNKSKKMVDKALQKVLEKFDWNKLEKEYRRVYTNVVEDTKKVEWKQYIIEDINIQKGGEFR